MGAILRVLSRWIRGEENVRNDIEGAETYQDENTRTSELDPFLLEKAEGKLLMDVCAIGSDAWRRGGRRCGRVVEC
jgi:hypothetical protein